MINPPTVQPRHNRGVVIPWGGRERKRNKKGFVRNNTKTNSPNFSQKNPGEEKRKKEKKKKIAHLNHRSER